MPVAPITDIKSLHLDELRGIAEPSYRADQITNWLYEKRVNSFAEMTDLPQTLRTKLADNFSFGKVDTLRVLGSKDTTQKFLFRLSDGNLIESVLIPASPALYGSPSDRRTICISTQVGCAYGCKFCASGLDGWKRNLRPDEIVNQIMAVEDATGERIDNIVFMGMGEPLLNYKNVLKAIDRITAPDGLAMSPRRITVSTAGVAKQIRQLGDDNVKFKLALSLHAPNDAKRNEIMPINESNNLKALTEALNYFYKQTKNEITFEYILFNNFNDSQKDADELIRIYRQVPADLVNIIEYNPIDFASYTKPSEERITEFISYLGKHKVNARLRRSRGKDIDAACGQLANKS